MQVIVIPLDEPGAAAAFARAERLCENPHSEIIALRTYPRPALWNVAYSGWYALPPPPPAEELQREEERQPARLCGAHTPATLVCAPGRVASVLGEPRLSKADAILIGAGRRSRPRARRIAKELTAWDNLEVVEP